MSGGTGAVSGPLPGLRPAVSAPELDSGAGTATHVWPLVSFLEFGALPTAAGCARLHTKNVLLEWKLHAVVEDAELLVSELVTNALQASWSRDDRPPVTLRLLANRERLLIEVWDRSPVEPLACEADLSSEDGRGLGIVAALSDRWSFRRVSSSLKVVWCELVIPRSQPGGGWLRSPSGPQLGSTV